MAYDQYRDFVRPTHIALWEKKGLSVMEIRYKTACLDADTEMLGHRRVTKSTLASLPVHPLC